MSKLAGEVAAVAGSHADRHDAEGSFAAEGVAAAQEFGYLAAPVPDVLGGRGARIRDVVAAQRVLGRACGTTALACAMHLHTVLSASWRWRRGDSADEPLLRKVADGLILASTDGSDWISPTTVALPVHGGWRVSGRISFTSLAPAATIATTMAVVGAPRDGNEVVMFGLPLAAAGMTIDKTWDAAGMRATSSHDVVLDNVFIRTGQVTGRRVWGALDRPLILATVNAWPVIAATYLGVAEGLRDAVLATASNRQAGLLDLHLRTAAWAIDGAVDQLGDDPEPTEANELLVQQAKLAASLAIREISNIALDAADGGDHGRPSPVTRAVRELLAIRYQPAPDDALLEHHGWATKATSASYR